MSLRSLELEQFRNQKNLKISLAPKTLIVGPNGSGKTSALEAIRVISVGKSFRTSQMEDMVQFEAPYFRLQLQGAKDKYELFYGTQFSENPSIERRLFANGKTVSYLDFLGKLPSVSFVPKDVDIVTEQPTTRRQFMDGILWQSHPEFRRDQLEYNRVLKERSRLLFFLKINRASIDELQPWNELLLGLAEKIRKARSSLIDFFNQALAEFSADAPGKLVITVEAEMAPESLEALQEQEIRLSHNLFGPHRDDLKILCNDRLARRFASRGQARTIIALLKAAEAKYLEKYSQTKPVILLDDLVSELDEKNVGWLFAVYGDRYQLIATSIDKNPAFKGWQEVKIQ